MTEAAAVPGGERARRRPVRVRWPRRKTVRWVIAFLLGLATLTAAGLSWRAAQIGSTAAFEDRQSISETVRAEQAIVERTIAVSAGAREYARYRADYAVAAGLDSEATRLASTGADALAAVSRGEAEALRRGATRRAVAAGVFGPSTLADDALRPSASPRPFDLESRLRALEAEQSAALDSPANLAPDRWAHDAEAIRVRIASLSRWAFIVVISVLLYTLAEVATSLRTTLALAGAGLAVYLVGLVGALVTRFF